MSDARDLRLASLRRRTSAPPHPLYTTSGAPVCRVYLFIDILRSNSGCMSPVLFMYILGKINRETLIGCMIFLE